MPSGRRLAFGSHHDGHGEQSLDDQSAFFRRRMHTTEVAHAVLPRREDMLEEAVDEVVAFEGAGPALFRLRLHIREADPAIGVLGDLAFAPEGGAKHVRGEIP